MGLGESKALGVSKLCELIYYRAAGIAQAHHLRTFVEGLAYRIVYSLAEDLEIDRRIDLHDLGVSAGNEQAEIRESRLAYGHVRLADEARQDMALKVIDHHEGFVQGNCQRFGEAGSDQQRAQQAGAAGKGYGRKIRRAYPGARKRFADYRHYVEFVGTGGQFRDNAAECAVDVLARDYV